MAENRDYEPVCPKCRNHSVAVWWITFLPLFVCRWCQWEWTL